MKNLQFKGIITQSTDNTKQYNEQSWTTTTLTSWHEAHIMVCVLHTLSLSPSLSLQISCNYFIAVHKMTLC